MIDTLSPAIRMAIRQTTPLAIVLGTYLLFAGHNQPGGGFAAGLVFGAVVTLRTVAGLQRRPMPATRVVAVGMLIAVAVAALPVVTGDLLLDQAVVSIDIPILGTVKSGSALPFDIGVTMIVVGMIMALLEGLAPIAATVDEAESSMGPEARA